MYCVKCGVELCDSEEKCALCGTVVYHPDIKRENSKKPYPPYKPAYETVNNNGVLFALSMLILTAAIITVLCDIKINRSVTWAGIVVGAIVLLYVVIILPMWFKRPNPVIFCPVDFAVAAAYLFLLERITGGSWFLSFAFPITGGFAIIFTAVFALVRYVRRGYLYIFGGAIIAVGVMGVLIEILINVTFNFRSYLLWSEYPFTACFIAGMALIVIGICKPLQKSLRRIFFV